MQITLVDRAQSRASSPQLWIVHHIPKALHLPWAMRCVKDKFISHSLSVEDMSFLKLVSQSVLSC
jgi:hypothetical protein